MYKVGDRFVVIVYDNYILSVVYIGINNNVNYLKHGDELFKILDVCYIKKPDIFSFNVGSIDDGNLYYRNKDFLFSEKNRKKEIISSIFNNF